MCEWEQEGGWGRIPRLECIRLGSVIPPGGFLEPGLGPHGQVSGPMGAQLLNIWAFSHSSSVVSLELESLGS